MTKQDRKLIKKLIPQVETRLNDANLGSYLVVKYLGKKTIIRLQNNSSKSS